MLSEAQQTWEFLKTVAQGVAAMLTVAVSVVGIARRFGRNKAKKNALLRLVASLKGKEEELQDQCDEKDARIAELEEKLKRAENRAKALAAKVRTEKLEEEIPPGKYDQNVTYLRDQG